MGKISGLIAKRRTSAPIVPFLSLLSFCLYFLLVPQLNILPWLGNYNEKRLLEILLIILVAFMFITNFRARSDFLTIIGKLSPGAKIMLLMIGVMGVLSSAYAAFPGFALLEVSLIVLMFAGSVCIACCYLQLGESVTRFVAVTLFLLGWFYLATFLGYYLNVLANDIPLTRYNIMSSNFANVRFFNQFQSWTLPLMVTPLLVYDNRSGLYKGMFILVAMGWWLLLFASACRGTMLGCLVAFPLTFLAFGTTAREWFKWNSLAIFGGLAGYLLFYVLIPWFMSIEVKGILDRDLVSSSMRVGLWEAAWKMIMARPWLGIGPMQFAAETGQIAAHPHNSFLHIAAEWGLPVALMASTLFVFGLSRWLKKVKSLPSDRRERNVHAALFASLVTATVHSLFSGIIVMPLSQIMMVFIVGWMLGVSALVKEETVPDHHRLKHLLLTLSLLMVVFGVVRPVLPVVLKVEELQTEFLDSHPDEKILKPRFWLQGQLDGYNGISNFSH